MTMAKKIDRLSATLVKVLKTHGLEGRLSEYRIVGQWEKTVGKVIARHAQPLSVRAKKLTLLVDSPAWMQQLSLLKPEIMEKVNRELGRDGIKDIMLRLGEVASREESPEDAMVRASLDEDDRAKIERSVQGINDPDIRESFRHLVEKDFLSKKRKQVR
jgi:predicted nucleic acid-binding Zn ribbon protein